MDLELDINPASQGLHDILGKNGYETAVEGKNAFICDVLHDVKRCIS